MQQQRGLALVTGGARRVGRAVCLNLAQAGFDILLTSRDPHSDPAQRTRADCRELGAQASVIHLDLADDAEVLRCGDRLADELARLDVLIHNAGRYEATPWGSITADEALEHYRVNALSPLLLTQQLAPLLRAARGCVILFGDIHVMGRPRRNLAAYNLSKAATVELVRTLARELAPEVRVNGIAPGVVAWPENTSPDEQRSYERRIPLGRSGTPEDAAKAVRYLVCEATYQTGEIIRVDGGRSLT